MTSSSLAYLAPFDRFSHNTPLQQRGEHPKFWGEHPFWGEHQKQRCTELNTVNTPQRGEHQNRNVQRVFLINYVDVTSTCIPLFNLLSLVNR